MTNLQRGSRICGDPYLPQGLSKLTSATPVRVNRGACLVKALLLLIAAAVFPGAVASADDDVEFGLELYGWLPNIDVELPSGDKSKITRDDIVNNLDMAFMGRLSARKNRWKLATDIIYFDLTKKGREPLRLPARELRKISLEASLIKPTLGYRAFQSDRTWVEVYAGARYFWVQPSLRIEQEAPLPPGSSTTSESDGFWDGLVGVRGLRNFADRWFVSGYADVGTGDSDSVVDLLLGVGYRFSRFSTLAAWRYMDYDFGDDVALKTMTINGPLVGVSFRF